MLFAAWGEVRQISEGGAERVLARRNERERLIASSEAAVQAEHARRRGGADGAARPCVAQTMRVRQAEEALRESERALAEASESERRTGWLIEQRAALPSRVRWRFAARSCRASSPPSAGRPSGWQPNAPSASSASRACAHGARRTWRSEPRARAYRGGARVRGGGRRGCCWWSWRSSSRATRPPGSRSRPSCARALTRRPRSRHACGRSARR